MQTAVPIIGLLLTVACSACAAAPAVQARQEMEESRNAYMQCVYKNPEAPAVCEDLKTVFDAKMQQFMETQGPVMPP